jgi:hypothetical protein
MRESAGTDVVRVPSLILPPQLRPVWYSVCCGWGGAVGEGQCIPLMGAPLEDKVTSALH